MQHPASCKAPGCGPTASMRPGAAVRGAPPSQLLAAPRMGIQIGDWHIEARQGPILSTEATDSLMKQCGHPILPEMVHGDSGLLLCHSGGLCIRVGPVDALLEWAEHARERLPGVRVAASQAWHAERQGQVDALSSEGKLTINPVEEEFDWTFTTLHKGTFVRSDDLKACIDGTVDWTTPLSGTCVDGEPTDEKIPYDRLKVPEPILYFCPDTILFEDELADNGESILSTKLRVMPSGFFFLQRHFMRVDDVVFRIRDTRVYHSFGASYVLRECRFQENTYEELGGMLPKDKTLYNNVDVMSQLVRVRHIETERIPLTFDAATSAVEGE